jgi:hypothetical protein
MRLPYFKKGTQSRPIPYANRPEVRFVYELIYGGLQHYPNFQVEDWLLG